MSSPWLYDNHCLPWRLDSFLDRFIIQDFYFMSCALHPHHYSPGTLGKQVMGRVPVSRNFITFTGNMDPICISYSHSCGVLPYFFSHVTSPYTLAYTSKRIMEELILLRLFEKLQICNTL